MKTQWCSLTLGISNTKYNNFSNKSGTVRTSYKSNMTHLQTILKTLHMLMARIQDFMQLRNNSSIICNKLPLKRILFNNLYIKPKLFLCRKVTKLKIIKVNLFSRKTSQCERNMETLLYSFKPPLHFSPLDLIVHNFLIL